MCTNFKHRTAADGTVCIGRTMEFPDVLPWELGVLSSDYEGKSASSGDAKTWKATHGVIGMSAFSTPQWLADGMNTSGLSGHALYIPGHCTYQEPKNDGTDIGALELLAFVLDYASLTPINPKPVEIGGTTFAPPGQGQGFRGLPGEGTSPSRF